jgi:hypothetical protein
MATRKKTTNANAVSKELDVEKHGYEFGGPYA